GEGELFPCLKQRIVRDSLGVGGLGLSKPVETLAPIVGAVDRIGRQIAFDPEARTLEAQWRTNGLQHPSRSFMGAPAPSIDCDQSEVSGSVFREYCQGLKIEILGAIQQALTNSFIGIGDKVERRLRVQGKLLCKARPLP